MLENYLFHFDSLEPKYVFWASRRLIDFLENVLRVNVKNPKSVATITNEDDTKILHEISRIQTLLQKFDKLTSAKRIAKRDITAYKNLDELQDAVVKANKQLMKKSSLKGGPKRKKIFDNKQWLILQPLNLAASCKYGKGTKWCISGDPERSDNKFEEYSEEGDQYLFVFDKVRKRKFAVQLEADGDVTVWDELDEEVPHLDLPDLIPDQEVQKIIVKFTGNPLLFFL